MADHFLWTAQSMRSSPYAGCDWSRSTYWHQQTSSCIVALYPKFDAPEGGLDYVTVSLQITSATPIGTKVSGVLHMYTNATAAAHSGSVTETLDEVVFTAIDLRPGGYATGTWHVAGTVQANNVLDASGEFRIEFPL